jgi:hypothetical protein
MTRKGATDGLLTGRGSRSVDHDHVIADYAGFEQEGWFASRHGRDEDRVTHLVDTPILFVPDT